MIPIGKAITLCRISRNISKYELARRMGCPRTYVTKVELGYTEPKIEQIFRFAEAMNIEPYRLVRKAEALMMEPCEVNPSLVTDADLVCPEIGAVRR